MTEASVERREDGTFQKGVSGNPTGRPPGKKNHLTGLKQDLEIAVRENMSSRKVQAIVDTMCQKAIEGNVGAAKLILDKVITNARDAEEVQGGDSGWTFVIKNVTVQKETPDDGDIIDVTPEVNE